MGYIKLLFVLVFVSGCLFGPQSPTENIVIGQGMSLDEFLDLNGLSLEGASEIADRNEDGENDLFVWDLDSDGKADVLIDINEKIQKGSHGTTLGFHKILVYDHIENVVWIADVGKSSGKIIIVHKKYI